MKEMGDRLEAFRSFCMIDSPKKEKAWEKFSTCMTAKHQLPGYRYLPLDRFLLSRFSLPLSSLSPRYSPQKEEGISPYFLLFVNGMFSSSCSSLPKDLLALPFPEARLSYGAFLRKREETQGETEKNPLVHLNRVLAREEDSLFLYLQPNVQIDSPIEMVFVESAIDESKPLCFAPRLEIFVGKGSKATFLMRTKREKGIGHCTNRQVQVTVEEGGEVVWLEEEEEGQEGGWTFFSLRATLKKKSAFFATHLSSLFSGVTYRDLGFQLLGEESRVETRVLQLLGEKSEGHTQIAIDHKAPHTFSKQEVRCIAKGRAKTGFSGSISIGKKGQKSDAYQLSRTLLLSKEATSYTQPNLQVLADDVKASHGATCSAPRGEELFYLQARGVGQQDAEKLFVRAFCRNILSSLPISIVEKRFSKKIGQWIEREEKGTL